MASGERRCGRIGLGAKAWLKGETSRSALIYGMRRGCEAVWTALHMQIKVGQLAFSQPAEPPEPWARSLLCNPASNLVSSFDGR